MAKQTELAWAAGFFDGEGHTGCRSRQNEKDGANRRPQLRLEVLACNDPTVLYRFRIEGEYMDLI
jgi:hypothetical protein